MHKTMYLFLAATLVISSYIICDELPQKPDIHMLLQMGVAPDQICRFTEPTAYKNIINAESAAAESAPVKKSLNQCKKSIHELVQTYAHEVAKRLSGVEEKTIMREIFGEVTELLKVIKDEAPQLDDMTLDPAAREQKAEELNAKCAEHGQQLIIKALPFVFALDQKQVKQEEIKQKFEAFFSHLIADVKRVSDEF